MKPTTAHTAQFRCRGNLIHTILPQAIHVIGAAFQAGLSELTCAKPHRGYMKCFLVKFIGEFK